MIDNNFKTILSNMRKRIPVDTWDLVPYLASESLDDKCVVNYELAKVYIELNDLDNAKSCMQRVMMFSDFSEDFLPMFVSIHTQLNDIEPIKVAYKEIGKRKMRNYRSGESLDYFNKNMYAYPDTIGVEKYQYDYDILEYIEQMAEQYKFKPEITDIKNRKIRIAYLTFQMNSISSVIYRINKGFAKYHDKSRFDINFYMIEPKTDIQDKLLDKFIKDNGCNLITSPMSDNKIINLIWLGKEIRKFKPDILVTNTGIADYSHYFITCMRPAPIIIGSIYAPPTRFVSPIYDYGISASYHPLIDALCDGSYVKVEIDLTEQEINSITRKKLNIPDDAVIIMSAGRQHKYESYDFWSNIIDILFKNPNVYFIVVGALKENLKIMKQFNYDVCNERVRFFKWRNDYLSLLKNADIYVDSYPSGGGFTLIDAMMFGIPVVGMKNDYIRECNQYQWSLDREIIPVDSLIAGNNEELKKIVEKLISNVKYRKDMGEKCKDLIYKRRGHPERMVKKYEEIYKNIIYKKLKEESVINNIVKKFLN